MDHAIDTITVGLVGAGGITSTAHLPVLKNIGGVHIVWIADVNASLVQDVGRAFGVVPRVVSSEPLTLPPCDIVLLATPVYAREVYLRYFSAGSRAILAEKPFALSKEEHLRYLEACSNVQVSCGYMRRTYATVRAIRQIVREGWFGTLRRIRYSEGGRLSKTAHASPTLDMGYRKGGGVLRDLGCHGLDVLVYATGATQCHVRSATIEWDKETDRQVVCRFVLSGVDHLEGSGCPVEFSVSWLSEQSNDVVFEFDRVWLRTGIRSEAEIEIASPSHKDVWTRMSLSIDGARSSYQAFFLEWQDILRAFRSGQPGELSAASSLLTTQIIDDVYRLGGDA